MQVSDEWLGELYRLRDEIELLRVENLDTSNAVLKNRIREIVGLMGWLTIVITLDQTGTTRFKRRSHF